MRAPPRLPNVLPLSDLAFRLVVDEAVLAKELRSDGIDIYEFSLGHRKTRFVNEADYLRWQSSRAHAAAKANSSEHAESLRARLSAQDLAIKELKSQVEKLVSAGGGK